MKNENCYKNSKPEPAFMLRISQTIASKTDTIFETWKDQVRESRYIESSIQLSENALGNSIPKVLEAMVKTISSSEEDWETIVKASLEHGSQRAAQGFGAAEIAREYSVLRQTILTILEPELLELSVREYHRVFGLIDAVIDEAISQCFDQFVEEETQKQEKIRKQLMLNNQELNRLLRFSQDSFSQLAHEIKTPLNSIMGYSKLLLHDSRAKKAEEADVSVNRVERVLRSSRKLLQLVNEALEISRSQSGKTRLQLACVPPVSEIESAIEAMEPLAQYEGVHLKIDCDRAPAQVTTDPSRLQQILTNLISNAIRYTDKGSIKVSCVELPNEKWSLTVSDTGIGIASEEQAHIWEPFYSASSQQYREGSTGLGLTIVAQLVQILEGEIELVSEPGEGSQFTLTFPTEVNDRNN